MKTKYEFHVTCQEDKFSGWGKSCYEAAVNAIGEERTRKLARNTKQEPYFCKGEVVSEFESGVSSIMSKNNITIATVTRLVQA